MMLIRKIPGMYMFVVGIILALIVVMILWGLGMIDTVDIIANILLYFLQWVFIMSLALLGAIVLGMFIGHRIFAHRGFTPFEKDMLEMRSDLKRGNQRLNAIEEELRSMREVMEREE